MLDLSSMLLGKVQLEVEALDLAEQVREAMRAQEPVAEGKDQALTLQAPSQPWCWATPRCSRGVVQRDQVHARARAHRPGDRARRRWRARQRGGARFRRRHSAGFLCSGASARPTGGLGLGLAIAVFTVRLPLHRDAPGSRPLREVRAFAMAEQVVEAYSLKGVRLAVEDQPDIRRDGDRHRHAGHGWLRADPHRAREHGPGRGRPAGGRGDCAGACRRSPARAAVRLPGTPGQAVQRGANQTRRRSRRWKR
ncbi:hypothetical protein NB693_21490 [Pantoea ananatis]|nr:hypothetical protein [Pantoea ananatis]